MRRRDFIKIVGVSSTGFMVAAYAPSKLFAQDMENPTIFSPSVFLRIDKEGIVTVTVQRSEMGQGVRTALPMLIAEELKVDWQSIRVEQADADDKYGDQSTGGSRSIRVSYDPFRKAGATAKAMLITAAANQWSVKTSDCYAEKGFVINKKNNKKLAYGDLISDASKLPIPENVELTDPEDFRIIGRPVESVGTRDRTFGRAVFGIDVKLPGIVYAAVERPPAFGGKAKSFDAADAKKIKGVSQVFGISSGVAVIAENTWKSFQAKRALKIDWDLGPNKNIDSEDIRNSLEVNLDKEGGVIDSKGDPDQDFGEDAKTFEAVYEVPFITHAPMEPMNTIAKVQNGKAELWSPSQNPQWAKSMVAQTLGIPEENVTLHVTLIGGAFGRRLQYDYAVEAAEIAAKLPGKPVKLTWTREDGMKHGFYRPPSMHKMTGVVKGNQPLLFKHHVIAPSISQNRFGSKNEPKDSDIASGTQVYYDLPNYKTSGTIVPTHVPISWLRAVYHTQNPFASEAFIDELAYEAGIDPLDFRKDRLPKDSRLRKVLETAADKSNWYEKLPKGKGRGLAVFEGYDSFCAMVLEVTVDDSNNYKVDKVTCAVDCGIVVNPNIARKQIEGGVIFALSAAMYQEITIKNGGVEQSNFDDYMMMTFEEAPVFDIYFDLNTYRVGGLGELAVAPTAPALVNALFDATGKRIRRLPVSLS